MTFLAAQPRNQVFTLRNLATALLLILCGVLFGCAETELIVHTAKETGGDGDRKGRYKIGKPYQIAGVWYYPKVNFDYAETGIASWYGPGFNGKKTANGEIYNDEKLTAAHRTLPMPSIVQVTNLENGRSLKVRINDRGPFKKGRIIDLSRKAARLLGFERKGTAKVRVEVLGAESRKAAVMMQSDEAGIAPPAVPLEPVTQQALPAPGASSSDAMAAVSPAPASSTQIATRTVQAEDATVTRRPIRPSSIFVQVGAFAQLHNAIRMKARVQPLGETQIVELETGGAATLFRVHIGPMASVAQADALINRLVANGLVDIQLVVR